MPKNITGTFTFPDGSPAAGAIVYLKLSQDAVAIGSSQIAPKLVGFVLNSSGQIQAGSTIYANDELTPAGTVYITSVIAVGGGLIYGPELLSIQGASPVNLNSLVPTNVGGIVISYPSPVLQNPVSPQTITGQSLTLTNTASLIAQGPVTLQNTLIANGNSTFNALLTFTTLVSSSANVAGSGQLRLASADSIAWRNNANNADILLSKNTSDQLAWPNVFSAAGIIFTAAAPTVAAAQVGFGSTTSTSATAGSNGDVPAQVVGYLIINVAGTNMKVPYYNV